MVQLKSHLPRPVLPAAVNKHFYKQSSRLGPAEGSCPLKYLLDLIEIKKRCDSIQFSVGSTLHTQQTMLLPSPKKWLTSNSLPVQIRKLFSFRWPWSKKTQFIYKNSSDYLFSFTVNAFLHPWKKASTASSENVKRIPVIYPLRVYPPVLLLLLQW